MLKYYYKNNVIEAGCDEAGRGSLAGPVFGAAVILPYDFSHPLLNDSKKVSEKKRYVLRQVIETHAIAFGIGMASNTEIDELNILQASVLAMHRALEKLTIQPEHIIVDGNRFHNFMNIHYTTIVRGDEKFVSIAAASILAKTYRDDYMKKLDNEYPDYGWSQNKGYPTRHHRQAIKETGPTSYHRMSFTLLPLQYKIEF